MPTMLNDHLLENLDQSIRQLTAAQLQTNRALLAALPQLWTLEDLAKRYAMSRDAARELLVKNGLHTPQGPGRREIRVTLEQVLQLDSIVKGQRRG